MDRIADIWGTRTPHARDTPWPVRVDLHLADGLTAADVDRWVPSGCVLCSNGCGAEIAAGLTSVRSPARSERRAPSVG